MISFLKYALSRPHVWGTGSGLAGSLLALLVWYDSLVDQSFKGLGFFLVLFIVLPACLALVASFVHAPVIAIPFICTLPFSVYVLFSSGLIWYVFSCFLYALSAYLKFKGGNQVTLE